MPFAIIAESRSSCPGFINSLKEAREGDSGASEVEALRARTSVNLLLTQSHHGLDSRRAAGR
jgi:hypothetical protein